MTGDHPMQPDAGPLPIIPLPSDIAAARIAELSVQLARAAAALREAVAFAAADHIRGDAGAADCRSCGLASKWESALVPDLNLVAISREALRAKDEALGMGPELREAAERAGDSGSSEYASQCDTILAAMDAARRGGT